MRIPIAKEGLLYGVALLMFGLFFLYLKFWIAGIAIIVIAVSIFLFFRYPDRTIENDTGLVYAPADGRIIDIRDEFDGNYFNGAAHKVSIFMSIFNVHINYAPVSGVVEFVRYTPGRFSMANNVDLSNNNESNYVGIKTDGIRVGIRQVAGWIARRIVCDSKIGDRILAGKRFGMIKFGSRVDVFMPKDYNLCVKNGECVRAGRTILGRARGSR